jgi:hypothetical protein
MNCQAGEHINKLVKTEFAPLAGLLRADQVKNAFYHIMRDWQVRLVYYPNCIHVRRIEKCSSCKRMGHRCSSRVCENYPAYAAKNKAKRAAEREEEKAKTSAKRKVRAEEEEEEEETAEPQL